MVSTRLHCSPTNFTQGTAYFVMERVSKSPLKELDIRIAESGYVQISQGYNIHRESVPRIFVHPKQLEVVIPTLQSYQRDFEKDSPDGQIKENHNG